jgi:hypothetical protein
MGRFTLFPRFSPLSFHRPSLGFQLDADKSGQNASTAISPFSVLLSARPSKSFGLSAGELRAGVLLAQSLVGTILTS